MATSEVIMWEIRHLARGRTPVAKRLLRTAVFAENFPVIIEYEPWNRPDVIYDVQMRRVTRPRSKWQTTATVYPEPLRAPVPEEPSVIYGDSWVRVEFYGRVPDGNTSFADVDPLKLGEKLMRAFGFTHIDGLTVTRD